MRVVVLGGNGTMGRLVVAELTRRGHAPVATSRSTGVDVVRGIGLHAVLRGAAAAVDCSSIATLSTGRASVAFAAGAFHLAAAARTQGVGHLVVPSIFGVHDEVVQRAAGYYRGKAEQERVLLAADVSTTIVRTPQWFEFAATLLARRIGPVAIVPRMRSRPIAGEVVATTLVDVVERGPGPEVAVAGPEQRDLADLAIAVAARSTPRVRVLAVTAPGMAPLADGGLLPGPEVPASGPRFEDWLANR